MGGGAPRLDDADGGCRLEVVRGWPEPPAWSTLLAEASAIPFFQRPAWLRAVCRHLPGREPLWLLVVRDGRPLGGMALVARRRGPFLTFEGSYAGTPGTPLLQVGLPDIDAGRALSLLARGLHRLATAPRTLSLSLVLPPRSEPILGPALADRGARRGEVPFGEIPLTGGPEQVDAAVLRRTKRKERNRALRAGCTAEVTTDPAVAAEYHPIHVAAARRWGVAPTPLPLLSDLLRDGEGEAWLSCVRLEGELIGAHLNLAGGDSVLAWHGTSRPEHADKHPAALLIWTDIVEACRRGAARLDLGGHGDLTGVARFKDLIGATPCCRYRYQWAHPAYRALARLRRLLRSGGSS